MKTSIRDQSGRLLILLTLTRRGRLQSSNLQADDGSSEDTVGEAKGPRWERAIGGDGGRVPVLELVGLAEFNVTILALTIDDH